MNGQLLNSWKEIASYLGRGVRTVQRWERDLALPVRRPRGHGRSAVIAFSDELDEWLRHSAVLLQHEIALVSPHRDRKLRVLAVDDDETQLYIAQHVIATLGHEPVTVSSAEAALRIACTKPDLVLLDVNLPHIHGFEVLRRIKTNPITGHIPVVMVSNTYEAWGAAPTALQLGAMAFVCKPLTAEIVRPVLEKVQSNGTASIGESA